MRSLLHNTFIQWFLVTVAWFIYNSRTRLTQFDGHFVSRAEKSSRFDPEPNVQHLSAAAGGELGPSTHLAAKVHV